MHTAEGHEAISAELVRLTLGGRGPDRPELSALFCAGCGKEAGSYACKIRHVYLNTGDAKASRD